MCPVLHSFTLHRNISFKSVDFERRDKIRRTAVPVQFLTRGTEGRDILIFGTIQNAFYHNPRVYTPTCATIPNATIFNPSSSPSAYLPVPSHRPISWEYRTHARIQSEALITAGIDSDTRSITTIMVPIPWPAPIQLRADGSAH
ncbi:uncharacterized protein RAG0_14879 [Rhynchosporium agropyri]|uniref:Uncharacterized protein n=1 Tax=Rhynchosporium agropyri TaxID=914238 RepID=A0A1E1LKR3_9HELO|nr:uncharacterized protein RAG0_14879 [Rhynchosporium agropyri]